MQNSVYSQSLRAPAEPPGPSAPDREKQGTAGSQLALAALRAQGCRQDHQVQKELEKNHQQQVHK